LFSLLSAITGAPPTTAIPALAAVAAARVPLRLATTLCLGTEPQLHWAGVPVTHRCLDRVVAWDQLVEHERAAGLGLDDQRSIPCRLATRTGD
jgi:hypothetical protein